MQIKYSLAGKIVCGIFQSLYTTLNILKFIFIAEVCYICAYNSMVNMEFIVTLKDTQQNLSIEEIEQ